MTYVLFPHGWAKLWVINPPGSFFNFFRDWSVTLKIAFENFHGLALFIVAFLHIILTLAFTKATGRPLDKKPTTLAYCIPHQKYLCLLPKAMTHLATSLLCSFHKPRESCGGEKKNPTHLFWKRPIFTICRDLLLLYVNYFIPDWKALFSPPPAPSCLATNWRQVGLKLEFEHIIVFLVSLSSGKQSSEFWIPG